MSSSSRKDQTSPQVRGPANVLPWKMVLLTIIGLSAILCIVSFFIPVVTGVDFSNYDGALRRYVDTGVEGSLATWWNGSLLFAAFILSAATAFIFRAGGWRGMSPWLILAALPLAFSVDEATVLHEHLARLVSLVTDRELFPYPWVIIGAPLAVAIIAVVVASAARLPAQSRKLLLVGYGLFFLGAVGFEVAAGVLVPGGGGLLDTILYNTEEFLEMTGAGFMVAAPLAAFSVARSDDGGVKLLRAQAGRN